MSHSFRAKLYTVVCARPTHAIRKLEGLKLPYVFGFSCFFTAVVFSCNSINIFSQDFRDSDHRPRQQSQGDLDAVWVEPSSNYWWSHTTIWSSVDFTVILYAWLVGRLGMTYTSYPGSRGFLITRRLRGPIFVGRGLENLWDQGTTFPAGESDVRDWKSWHVVRIIYYTINYSVGSGYHNVQ